MAGFRCEYPEAFKPWLASWAVSVDENVGGQGKYVFDDGLIITAYDTGAVVFQGKNHTGENAKKVLAGLDAVNKGINIS